MLKHWLKNPAVRQVGSPVLHIVAHRYVGEGKLFDLRLGFALFKEKRTPVGAKMSALVLGAVAMMGWNLLELPVEALMAFLLPFVGMVFQVAWNGLETVIGSLLFASLILPRIAPQALVHQVRTGQAEPVLVAETASSTR
jgi:hypothetical protein